MRNPFNRQSKEITEQPEQTRLVVMSSGELVEQSKFRSHIETSMQRVISSGNTANDHLLASAVALSVPAMVCVNYHSNVTSSIPIVAQDKQGNVAGFVPMKFMLDNRMRWLIRSIDASLLIWGYALVRKKYNRSRVPTKLEWLHPLNVRINVDGKQNIKDYHLQRENEDLPLDEVIYISDFDFHDTGNPTSKLENAFAYIGLEHGITKHAGSFFYNGATIAGIVTIEGNFKPGSEEMKKFRKEFERQFKGSGNAHKIAFLDKTVTYTPISQAPADLAMPELSDQAKQFVAAAFGVNPALVGLGDVSDQLSASSTLDATKRNFIDMEATPSLDFILDNLNTQWALKDFSVPILLVSDSSAMAMMNDGISTDDMGVAVQALNNGIFTFDEAREHVGYKPFDMEDDIHISRDPTYASSLYSLGVISRNGMRLMLDLLPEQPDYMIVDGKTYNISDIPQVAQSNLEALQAPPVSPFGLSITQAQPPQLSSGGYVYGVNMAHGENDETALSDIKIRANDSVPDDTIIMVNPNYPEDAVALRIGQPLTIGVDLSEHNLISLAQRELGRALAGQDGIVWVAPDDWRAELIRVDKWSPVDIDNIVRTVKLDFNRTDVWTSGFFVEDGAVFLRLATTEATTRMSELIRNDLASVNIDGIDATPLLAVRLCSGDVSPDLIPTETTLGKMPIGFLKLVAFGNNRVQHKWRLRGYVDKADQTRLHAQRDEISKWQQRAARAGVSADWSIEYLPDNVVRFIRGDDSSDGFVFMDLSERDELLSIQRAIMDAISDDNIEQQSPDTFHITLTFASDVNDKQMSIALDEFPTDFKIRISGMGVFNNPGERALHLIVDHNDELDKIQAQIFKSFDDQSIALSDYSIPERWQPHITVAFLPKGVDMPQIEFEPFEIGAGEVIFSRENYEPFVSRSEFPDCTALQEFYGKRSKLTVIELFKTARSMLNIRALQALRLEWEGFIEALIADTRAGNVKDRARFGVLLRGEINRFARRAFRDGLVDGGVSDATLSDSDDAKIKTMIQDNSAFVSGLSQILFKGDGISDAQAAGKPSQWWAGTIMPFYQAGFKSAGANPMMEFVGPFGVNPCATCRHLFGQKHRLNVWDKNGLNMVGGSFVGQRTICGKGGHCKHSIVTVVGRARGSIRAKDMSEEVERRLDELLKAYRAELEERTGDLIVIVDVSEEGSA